jgi:TonB family protein
LYGKRSNQSTGEGTGNVAGDQGDLRGTTDGTAYTGDPGGGGISFSLSGRKSTSLAKPAYTSNEQGVVVVRIWVNENGVVTRAQAGEKGTTVTDASLFRAAENAALRSSFSSKANAAPQQGTISYKFIKLQ